MIRMCTKCGDICHLTEGVQGKPETIAEDQAHIAVTIKAQGCFSAIKARADFVKKNVKLGHSAGTAAE